MSKRKTALFSVPPHEGLEDFARKLSKAGWSIIATRDARKFLKEKGAECVDVAEFVGEKDSYGFPPTLHPKIEAALTTDSAQRIDLVYDITYGLDVGNDVGGHTLLALAAKGGRIPVHTPEDMQLVVASISKTGDVGNELREYLIEKTNFKLTDHFLELLCDSKGGNFTGLLGERKWALKEGENTYQSPSHLYEQKGNDELGIPRFNQVSDEPPCFTNVADLDSILETLSRLKEALSLNGIPGAFIAVAAKHGNACGVGVNLTDQSKAIEAALWGDAKGIWGGEVITNFPIDESHAQLLLESEKRKETLGSPSWMLDVLACPSLSEGALEALSSRKNRKLFVNPNLSMTNLRSEKMLIRQVRGGFLTQPPGTYVLDLNKVEWVNKPASEKTKTFDFLISWAVAYTSNHGGNEVAIAKDGALVGVGGGPSTIDAANTALSRAKEQGHETTNAIFCADAFFPFTDVPEILSSAGCIGGTVPAGGKREEEVRKFFDKQSMSVGFIPSQYRGFFRH
ncbi:MAG: hypothetical protein ABH950_03525 [Candidatus Altiarchaeota archaeon]